MDKIEESNWTKATKETLNQGDRDKLMMEARDKLIQEEHNLKNRLKESDSLDEYKKEAA